MKILAIRHGEVLLLPVDKLPEGRSTTHKSFVVGHSETGHHHVLEATKEFEVTRISDDELYVRLFEPAKLVHKKTVNRHNDLTIIPGSYKVIRKSEYDPFEKVMRQVWD